MTGWNKNIVDVRINYIFILYFMYAIIEHFEINALTIIL